MHIHTTASDGQPTPAEVLTHVEQYTDLDVIAITDHDTLTGAKEARRLHRAGHYRFDFVLGMEVTSIDGHILALFIKELIPKNMPARKTIAAIHDQGGLAVAAHPLLQLKYIDPNMVTADGVGVDALFTEQFDAVELINGSPLAAKENHRVRILNRSIMYKAELGSSDAHITDAVGKAYTLFPGTTAEDFRRAIGSKTTEAVSTRYHWRELAKYLRFMGKMKIREAGKKLFGKMRRVASRHRRS